MPPKLEPKRPVGRPPLDPTGAQNPVSVRITDREKQHLQKKYGSVNKGFRAWIATVCPPGQ
jgi:hypothetical protein